MTLKFHLLDAMDKIPAQLKQDIMRELEAANERVARFIQLDRLDIVVAPDVWVSRKWGITGYPNGPGRITIGLDPASPRLHDRERSDRNPRYTCTRNAPRGAASKRCRDVHSGRPLRQRRPRPMLRGGGWRADALLRGGARRRDHDEDGGARPARSCQRPTTITMPGCSADRTIRSGPAARGIPWGTL